MNATLDSRSCPCLALREGVRQILVAEVGNGVLERKRAHPLTVLCVKGEVNPLNNGSGGAEDVHVIPTN